MTRRVERHPRALDDVEEAAVYIGRESRPAAERFLDAVEATLRLLGEDPRLGSPRELQRDELSDVRSFRVRGFPSYLVFHRADPQRHRGPTCAARLSRHRRGLPAIVGSGVSLHAMWIVSQLELVSRELVLTATSFRSDLAFVAAGIGS